MAGAGQQKGKKQGKKQGSKHSAQLYTEKLDPRLQKDIIQNLQNIQKESTLAANDTQGSPIIIQLLSLCRKLETN